jgi:hypothetical protein
MATTTAATTIVGRLLAPTIPAFFVKAMTARNTRSNRIRGQRFETNDTCIIITRTIIIIHPVMCESLLCVYVLTLTLTPTIVRTILQKQSE